MVKYKKKYGQNQPPYKPHIRENPMLDFGDILLLKDSEAMYHIVFTTECTDYASYKKNL